MILWFYNSIFTSISFWASVVPWHLINGIVWLGILFSHSVGHGPNQGPDWGYSLTTLIPHTPAGSTETGNFKASPLSGKDNKSILSLRATSDSLPFTITQPFLAELTPDQLRCAISSFPLLSMVFSPRSHPDKATGLVQPTLLFEEHWPSIVHKELSLMSYTDLKICPSPVSGMRQPSGSALSQQGAYCSLQSRQIWFFFKAGSQIAGTKSYYFNRKICSAGAGLQKTMDISFCVRHQQVIWCFSMTNTIGHIWMVDGEMRAFIFYYQIPEPSGS